MTVDSCVPKIRSLYNTFSKTEKKIAKYTLKNTFLLTSMSIDMLSTELDVGRASILRFCRKIGFNGYQDFKLGLAKEEALLKKPIYSKEVDKGNIAGLLEEVTNENIETLRISLQKVDPECIKDSAEILLDSNDIIIFAQGISFIIGNAVKYKFMKLGLKCDVASDYHLQCFNAANFTNRSVLLVIDLTGQLGMYKPLIKIAQKRKAKIIAIVNYEKSEITEVADISILTESTESPLKDGELTSMLSQINIIDMLYTLMAQQRGKEHMEHIDILSNLLLKK